MEGLNWRADLPWQVDRISLHFGSLDEIFAMNVYIWPKWLMGR